MHSSDKNAPPSTPAMPALQMHFQITIEVTPENFDEVMEKLITINRPAVRKKLRLVQPARSNRPHKRL